MQCVGKYCHFNNLLFFFCHNLRCAGVTPDSQKLLPAGLLGIEPKSATNKVYTITPVLSFQPHSNYINSLMCCHFFVSSITSWGSVYNFLCIGLSPIKHARFSEAKFWMRFFLISVSSLPWFVYQKTTDFCILTLGFCIPFFWPHPVRNYFWLYTQKPLLRGSAD